MANKFLFSDNAQTVLAAPITDTATTCTLASGTGALFPSPAAGEQFSLTFQDAATGLQTEIVYCTSRTVDTLTIVRGQESTTAQAWIAGDIAANMWTAGQARAMSQTTSSSGVLLSTQVITTSGVPSYPAGTVSVDMELVGGGASGGGTPDTDGTHCSAASGGGSGAMVKAVFDISAVEGVALTIGAGAVPGAAGADGNDGEDTVLSGLVTAPGGRAGLAGLSITGPGVTGDSGNTAAPTVTSDTVTTIASPGAASQIGVAMAPTNVASGAGGPSFYGPGASNVSNGPGADAVTPGAGGSGSSALANASATVGGAGKDGQVIIRSYS